MAKTIFNSVKGMHPRRNSFSAHTYRNDFTAALGVNIPVYQQHTTAGTRVLCSASALVRLQALISPIMDNVDFYCHFWQVPYRLIENDRFTAFISGELEDDAEYDALFLTPKEFASGFLNWLMEEEQFTTEVANGYVQKFLDNGSLLDFLGYDKSLFKYTSIAPVPGVENMYEFNGMNNYKKLNFRPLIMYYMLHEHWYMNENVPYFEGFIDLVHDLVKNQNVEAIYNLLYLSDLNFGSDMLPHGWEKDYFTSALPNVQFGSPVSLPIQGSAPVIIPKQPVTLGSLNWDDARLKAQGFQLPAATQGNDVVLNVSATGEGTFALNGTNSTIMSLNGDIVGRNTDNVLTGSADLSEATAITINELRFANALQVFKEREMRFGRRRLEHYIGFFDVTPEDLRLQVPKYLGGGRIPINISDIEQTSATQSGQPLGRLAGKGTAVAGGFAGFKTWCSEETLLLGIAFAMPHITYANTLSRFLTKTNDRYDYFNPSFEHLGEQAIECIELYAGSSDAEFGYTPRYTEYRYHGNEVHGAFKDTLAHWTLARIFDSQPALNADFVYMQPSVFNRIFAVEDSKPMLASMIFRQRIIQPVSKYGTPMLLS